MASTDPAVIEQWWCRWPRANVGIVTGPESGLVVLDVDPKHGGDASFSALERESPDAFRTVRARSGGGGLHLYFKYQSGVKNSQSILGRGLDVRSSRGNIVAPGSRHVSGDAYAWIEGARPDQIEIMPWPALPLLRPSRQSTAAKSSPHSPDDVFSPGERNSQLTRVAGAMRRKGLSSEEILPSLMACNLRRCLPPLEDTEVKRIARSIERYDPEVAALPSSPAAARSLIEQILHEDPAKMHTERAIEACVILSERDMSSWGEVRARMKKYPQVMLREITKSMKKFVSGNPDGDGGRPKHGYVEHDNALCFIGTTQDGGTRMHRLTNFVPRITKFIVVDDGGENGSYYLVNGRGHDGRPLPPLQVPVKEFDSMTWVTKWGTSAIVNAGRSIRDQARAATMYLSGDVPQEQVAGHLGWVKTGEGPVFLTTAGNVSLAERELDARAYVRDTSLALYDIVIPASTSDLRRAVQASIDFLTSDIAPAHVVVPLFAAVYRAPLSHFASANQTLFLVGPSGCKKSSLVFAFMSHYGPRFDVSHSSANWTWTANALEAAMSVAKDCLFCIDDFAPSQSCYDAQEQQRKAARIIRNQANGGSRNRLNRDFGLDGERPSRCLLVSSGEHLPRGQSVLARLLTVEVAAGDIDNQKLSRLQGLGADGVPARAMYGYLQWIARNFDSLEADVLKRQHAWRDRAREGSSPHDRFPDLIASLQVGIEHFLCFAMDCSIIDQSKKDELLERSWEGLQRVVEHQREYQGYSSPATCFIKLLKTGFATGRCYLSNRLGHEPDMCLAVGWNAGKSAGGGPSGTRIGWLKEGSVYLLPQAAYQAAQNIAGVDARIDIDEHMLRRHLKNGGHLASTSEGRGKIPIRKVFEGVEHEVLHFRLSTFVSIAGGTGITEAQRPVRPLRPVKSSGEAGGGQ